MNFSDFLKNNLVILDGGMGTLLQQQGLLPGEYPERWNRSHPQVIRQIHKDYYEAGSHVVSTNTFGANALKFSEEELEEIVRSAVENAKAARAQCACPEKKFIALDIGPSGRLLKPLGDLDFVDAVALFAKTVRLGVKYGVDLIFIETMNDGYETKAALLAAKENSNLPVLVSNAYSEDGKLLTGASPAAMVAMLEGMGADAIGANCSLGPEQLSAVAKELLTHASVPVLLKPNAGLPRLENGKTVFDVEANSFAAEMEKLAAGGLRLLGGCCGTTPDYIRALSHAVKSKAPQPLTKKDHTVVSSYSHAVFFGKDPVLIGERINPTGKKRFRQALLEQDMDYILNEAVNQQDKGVHVLDVNVGLPEIDEVSMLTRAVTEIQAVVDLPLQIDSASIPAMESALRRYNGKALINSVNGKAESMEAVFPLVKKYGGAVVCLTLDENGIPETADGRFAIAQKILNTAERYGIQKKDLIFDTLAMTVSADPQAAIATLQALRRIHEELGCHTSLGVSNVSFGLPNRDALNSSFFTMALENGLSAAIMNPYSAEMMKSYHCYRALKGLDDGFATYMEAAQSFGSLTATPAPQKSEASFASQLQQAIGKGLAAQAGALTRELLKEREALSLINEEIIPALNQVGRGFEAKTVYLPQLLMSAEAAKSAFEVIKESMAGKRQATGKAAVVLATVQGDIHDIGKNIVRLLLENYGFAVTDLGKDVPPEAIVDTVIRLQAPLVGLSALMTTTVPAMEKTIRLLQEKAPWCKIVSGGAVLTPEYAKQIGADHYGADAMDTVRFAESI